jgi:hypothetical protein
VAVPGERPPARLRKASVALAAVVLVVVVVSAAGSEGEPTARPTAAAVRPAYQGHYVTQDDVATLQEQGLATASVRTRELACQGIELFFDTSDQRDAYLAEYGSRFPVEPPYLPGDPCRPYRDSPRYVAGG